MSEYIRASAENNARDCLGRRTASTAKAMNTCGLLEFPQPKQFCPSGAQESWEDPSLEPERPKVLVYENVVLPPDPTEEDGGIAGS